MLEHSDTVLTKLKDIERSLLHAQRTRRNQSDETLLILPDNCTSNLKKWMTEPKALYS
jgi:hypothetical protein